MKKLANYYHYCVFFGLIVIMLSPIIITFIYSIATSWSITILPEGVTFKWYIQLWHDERFMLAFGHSLLICFLSLIISIVIVFPVIFIFNYYIPKYKSILNIIVVLPFVIPAMVSSVGLLQLYSTKPLLLVGNPLILIGCYFTIALPFIYRAIANNLQAINLNDLIDTAKLLGSSTFRAILQIILPNLKKGVLSAFFLVFSFLMGEFLFANMLVGTSYETLQVYLYNIRGENGHYTSTIVISYFMFILIATIFMNVFNQVKGSQNDS